jgi:transposase InsO family protein
MRFVANGMCRSGTLAGFSRSTPQPITTSRGDPDRPVSNIASKRSARRVCATAIAAYRRGVTLDFSRPGKPTDNAYIEAFNGRFRAECLNAHWFLTLDDARSKLEDWRRYYNEECPHGAPTYQALGLACDFRKGMAGAAGDRNPRLT